MKTKTSASSFLLVLLVGLAPSRAEPTPGFRRPPKSMLPTETVSVERTGSRYPEATNRFPGRFRTGQPADLMLSGYGFNLTGGPLMFNHPSHVASDGTRLVLCDRNNNRVLVWNSPPSSNTPPDLVLGQRDFLQNDPGAGLDQMNWPMAASIADGRLVVADTDNDRVLVWNRLPTASGQAADFQIRIRDFSTFGTMPLSWPWGLWTDGRRLMVSATQGGALMVWKEWPADGTAAPSFILRDPAFGTPRTLTCDGVTLALDDHNCRLPVAPGPGGTHATYFWRSLPESASDTHHFVRQGSRLRGGTVDGSLVLLGEGRMEIHDGFPDSATDAPRLTLNLPFGGDGIGLAVAGGRFYTVDENLNRVLVFNSVPVRADARPDFAIGSPHVDTNTLRTEFLIQNPAVVTDGTSLWVGSDFDRSLYLWKKRPDTGGAHPDLVYRGISPWAGAYHDGRLVLGGQGRIWIWNQAPKDGELPDRVIAGRIGNVVFDQIRGIALDARHLAVADYGRQKVYVWSGIPATNAVPVATLALGGRPGRISSDGTYLAVPISGPPHAVAIYRLEGLTDASQPVVTLLNRDNLSPVSVAGVGFNLPEGALLDGTRLWVADTSYNRVLGWNSMEEVLAGARASLILGAADTSDVGPNIGRSSLFMPGSLAWDGSCLWVGEFKFSSRLLRFSPRPVAVERAAVEQGRLQLEIHGAPGQEFSVQSSTNLLEWKPEGTGRIPSDGSRVSVSAVVDGASVGNFLRTLER